MRKRMVMHMEGRELADSVRQITNDDVTGFIETYQALQEMNKIDAAEPIMEYNYPKLVSTWFTYNKKKDKNGKILDDGKCKVCGKDRQYLLIKPGVPHMCYRCYQAARAYKNTLFDPLHLKSKRDLTDADCKRIVKYMNTYSKKKLVALAAVGAYLALGK